MSPEHTKPTQEDMKIIALCGMPGAGKSTFKDLARQLGVPSWYVGQPLVELCQRNGVEPTYANRMAAGLTSGLFDPADPLKFIQYSLLQMRARHPGATAIIFDSVRSLAELEFLRSVQEDVALVAVLLGRAERIRRLVRRDAAPAEQVEARDRTEIGLCDPFHRSLGVGQLIAMADSYVLTPADDAQAPSVTLQVGELLQRLGISPSPGAPSQALLSAPRPFSTKQSNKQ